MASTMHHSHSILEERSVGQHTAAQRDEEVVRLRKEIKTLKQDALNLQGDYDELVHEKNFYRVKVSELTDIVEARGDDATSQLVAKSVQNAELSTEVDRLKHELKIASATIEKLGSQGEQNKRIHLEVSELVYALRAVQVDGPTGQTIGLTGANICDVSLMSVKAKVQAIMDDRMLLADRCQLLEKERLGKDEKIAALEAQFHLLNRMNLSRNDHCDSSHSDAPYPPTSAFSVSSFDMSTGPVHEIHLESTDASSNTSNNGDVATETSYYPIVERSVSSAMSLATKASTLTFDSKIGYNMGTAKTQTEVKDDTTVCTDESSTKLTSPTQSITSGGHEVESLKSQLAESKNQHRQFKEVCQTAFSKMKSVEQDFFELQKECEDAKNKRDQLKLYVKDIIEQYKTLNKEHEQSLDELTEARCKIQQLQEMYDEIKEEKKHLQDYGADILEEDGLADDTDKLIKAYLVARSTITTLKEKVSSTEREVEEAEKKRVIGGRAYRDAVAKCRQVEHELRIMESRVAESEGELEVSKKETLKYKEEAKHTRRRLTAYMRGKCPLAEDLKSTVVVANPQLLMPELQ